MLQGTLDEEEVGLLLRSKNAEKNWLNDTLCYHNIKPILPYTMGSVSEDDLGVSWLKWDPGGVEVAKNMMGFNVKSVNWQFKAHC